MIIFESEKMKEEQSEEMNHAPLPDLFYSPTPLNFPSPTLSQHLETEIAKKNSLLRVLVLKSWKSLKEIR
jgi:hypothetical protein